MSSKSVPAWAGWRVISSNSRRCRMDCALWIRFLGEQGRRIAGVSRRVSSCQHSPPDNFGSQHKSDDAESDWLRQGVARPNRGADRPQRPSIAEPRRGLGYVPPRGTRSIPNSKRSERSFVLSWTWPKKSPYCPKRTMESGGENGNLNSSAPGRGARSEIAAWPANERRELLSALISPTCGRN